MLEKHLVKKVEYFCKKNNINHFKIHGNLYQKSGMVDLLIFNKYFTYGLELKTDMKNNKPSLLQVATSEEYKNNLIVLFVDFKNYVFLLNNIKNNNFKVLKDYSNKQRIYWRDYYAKKTNRMTRTST